MLRDQESLLTGTDLRDACELTWPETYISLASGYAVKLSIVAKDSCSQS